MRLFIALPPFGVSNMILPFAAGLPVGDPHKDAPSRM
jgi:hypothetical protein